MLKLLVMFGNQPPSQAHVQRLMSLRDDIRVVVADSETTAVRHASDTEVILGHRYLYQTLPHTRCLKWIQSTAAGVQHLLSSELVRISPVLTRCPIFSEIVALHAFTLALATIRRIPDAAAAQLRGQWSCPFDMLPNPQTAMILGMGYIGRAIAAILGKHGITVLGVDKNPSPEKKAACDKLLDNTNWRRFLHRADLCFIALPLTRETVNLFDEAALKALPSHAVLVNVARGGIVDTNALVGLLKSGHLGGAALDVIEPVPQNPADPIWKTPRLLITPKVSVFHPERQRKLEEYIEMQVGRYIDGKELLHKVDINELAELRHEGIR